LTRNLYHVGIEVKGTIRRNDGGDECLGIV
jgi:hypothetical protein